MAERTEQKTRTRDLLLEGARAIMSRGESLSIQSVAKEAGISKASAYRYFSDPALLAAEAGLHIKMKPYEKIVAGAASTKDRLVAISCYHFDLAIENEVAFRTYLSLNLQASIAAGEGLPRRGARRIKAYRRAMAEAVPPIPDEQVTKVAAALSMATGVEALIALFDIAQCSPALARSIVEDTAVAICTCMLSFEECYP